MSKKGKVELKRKRAIDQRPVSELIPWAIQITDDIILCKDGSAMVCFVVEGVDIEGISDMAIDGYAQEVELTLQEFTPQIMVWSTVHRRKSQTYLEGARFEDTISAYIDAEWEKTFQNGAQYENRHYISILWRPNTGAFKFFDRVAQFNDKGYSIPMSVIETIKSMVGQGNAFLFDHAQLENMLQVFTLKLKDIESGMNSLNLSRLQGNDLRVFLHNCCSPAGEGQDVVESPMTPYLDTYLSDNQLYVFKHHLEFAQVGSRYVSAISIKSFPENSYPGLIDILLATTCELNISQVMHVVEDDQAESYITKQEKHLLAMAKSIGTYLREMITKEESKQVNVGKLALAEDASDALGELTELRRRHGYYNFTVTCYGNSKEELEAAIGLVSSAMKSRGFLFIIERDNLVSAWAGTLPGQWFEIERWHWLNIANYADMAHYRTINTGPRLNEYLTDEMHFPHPSLTCLSTEYATPYFFNFHWGDLAHTFIVGPSRAGKSIITNFLVSQFGKYGKVNRFIFDKDHSCLIPTVLQGGRYIDLMGDDRILIKMNPLHLLYDEVHWEWITKWLEQLLTYRNYELKAGDDEVISHALHLLHEQPKSQWRLSTLYGFLTPILQEQLGIWCFDGALARYFDNEEDDFNLSNFVAIGMDGIFENQKLAIAFLDYSFYSISLKLDGSPTLVELEECWFMFSFPHMEEKIKDWLKTFGKKNAFIVFTTQSLDEISKSKIFATIIDNVPNRIYLPNDQVRSHYDLYREKFRLTDEQITRIENATRKRNYYIVKPGMSRMVDCVFPDSILAVMRSNQDALARFYRHRDSGKEDWKINYIEEALQ